MSEFSICPASLIRHGVHNILLTELPTEANISKNMARFFSSQKKYLDIRQKRSAFNIRHVAICLSKTELTEDTDIPLFADWNIKKTKTNKGVWKHFSMYFSLSHCGKEVSVSAL